MLPTSSETVIEVKKKGVADSGVYSGVFMSVLVRISVVLTNTNLVITELRQ